MKIQSKFNIRLEIEQILKKNRQHHAIAQTHTHRHNIFLFNYSMAKFHVNIIIYKNDAVDKSAITKKKILESFLAW